LDYKKGYEKSDHSFVFCVEERQISVPVEVTCDIDDNVVTVGTVALADVTGLLGELGL
jgi:hypothetical protein